MVAPKAGASPQNQTHGSPIMGSRSTRNSRKKPRSVKRRAKAATIPAPQDMGAELRTIAKRLERIEAYLMVAGSSLDGNPSYSGYVTVLLRIGVGNLLFKQIRALEDMAAQCDGGPSSERDHEDDPDEDDDMDAESQS